MKLMSKMRVYEFAKKHNVASKQVIELMKTMNIAVKNHMGMIEQDVVQKLEGMLKNPKVEEKRSLQDNQQERQPNAKQKEAAIPKKNRPAERHSKPVAKNNHKDQQHGTGKANAPQGKTRDQKEQRNISNQPRVNHTVQKQSNRPNSTGATNQRGPKPAERANQASSKPAKQPFQGRGGATSGQGNGTKNQSWGSKKSGQGNHGMRNDGNRFGGGHRNNKKQKKAQKSAQPPRVMELPKKIEFEGSLTIGELAMRLHREASEVIKKLFMIGIVATKNQNLDKDTIELICDDYGVEVEEYVHVDESIFEDYEINDLEEDLVERPPVVTIMGHVDHGKTTLLDSIRNTKVTEGEAGGITQHIGAYQVKIQGKPITFLDTPGHAAFTTMRARGAKITDITILVVAADDGVMPQTIEAIDHAKAAEVPIIVAVNKIDRPGANPDRVMQELTEHGLVSEAWGGDTIFVEISAKFNQNIDTLLEMVLLVAEVAELKANPKRLALGSVVEAHRDKGKGSVATLLVQNGTLRVGDPIVVGTTFGKVRAMVNDIGRRVKEAPPSTPVEITGLSDVPQAGDAFQVFADEKKARQIGEARLQKMVVEQRGENSKISLEDLFNQIKEGDVKEIHVVVKADVQGSAEAVAGSLQKIEVEGVKIKIIHTGVGAITESDIILASASNAIVIGFNVRPDANARNVAEQEKVDVRLHTIIYKAIEEMEAAMQGMLDPEYEEKVIGQAEVRQTFKVSKVGTIAGSFVTEGKITRDSSVRVIRDSVIIYDGKIEALKRFKDDAKEVMKGYECGITIEKYNDIKEGDIIEAYVMEEIDRTKK